MDVSRVCINATATKLVRQILSRLRINYIVSIVVQLFEGFVNLFSFSLNFVNLNGASPVCKNTISNKMPLWLSHPYEPQRESLLQAQYWILYSPKFLIARMRGTAPKTSSQERQIPSWTEQLFTKCPSPTFRTSVISPVFRLPSERTFKISIGLFL